ncbi:hypothetical protein AABB24_013354, partial [Solanum stoloniferum]
GKGHLGLLVIVFFLHLLISRSSLTQSGGFSRQNDTMAAWTAAARQAANLSRFSASKSVSSTKQGALLIQRRGLAGGSDHHGPPKVNFWQDPMSPSKWKEEHFVIVSLTGWGLTFYGAYKFFTKGKKEKKEEKVGDGSH